MHWFDFARDEWKRTSNDFAGDTFNYQFTQCTGLTLPGISPTASSDFAGDTFNYQFTQCTGLTLPGISPTASNDFAGDTRNYQFTQCTGLTLPDISPTASSDFAGDTLHFSLHNALVSFRPDMTPWALKNTPMIYLSTKLVWLCQRFLNLHASSDAPGDTLNFQFTPCAGLTLPETSETVSPWYNRHGWLGVKNQ